MPLSIDKREVAELARTLAKRMGANVEQAVVQALRERLERTPGSKASECRRGELLSIGRECAALHDYDLRRADEVLGYDEHGISG